MTARENPVQVRVTRLVFCVANLALFLDKFPLRHQILTRPSPQLSVRFQPSKPACSSPQSPTERLPGEDVQCPHCGRGTVLPTVSQGQQPCITAQGALCVTERPQGALHESFPVILQEVLPFFTARFDIFAGLTSGAFWSRKKAVIHSFIFTKPLIGFFIKLDSIISSVGVGA